MRSLVSSNRIKCLSRVALAGILAVIGSGCSSDFTRFDKNLYSALPQPANASTQQYPGEVDGTTTASIGPQYGAPHPTGVVAPPQVASDHEGYQPQIVQNPYPQTVQTAPQAYQSQTSSIVKAELPKVQPVTTPSAQVDQVRTSAVSKVETAVSATNQPYPGTIASTSPVGGWTAAGGTAITLASGETLYNVSKRYGVPVEEIMKANRLSNASAISAGQQIVIPTYVYTRAAPVSAPDSNPDTRAARATTGLIGQADPGKVAVPTQRPQTYASINQAPEQAVDPLTKQRYKPKQNASEPNTEQNVPDYSVITGSVQQPVGATGYYKVAPGDSLSGIASRNNLKLADLMAANKLTSPNIRIGQTLVLPGLSAAPLTQANNVLKLPNDVDPIITGSNTTQGPKPYVKPEIDDTITGALFKAPQSTGIESFRWPVQGRIISAFGQKRSSGQNDGIDISVPEGTSVKAAENGVVIYSGSDLEGFGNLILVRHADGYVTAYAHNKSNDVAKGAQVRRGEVIARSGRTGAATVPMLHFEVRKDSKPVDPVKYLANT
jgi:murein DD-endopeptidase MepM/ murein hydrolase activator NlpD